MRLVLGCAAVLAALGAGCAHYGMFECQDETSCNLGPGGRCRANPGGGQLWCSYPDPGCSSGYRYSDSAIGDRECVPDTPVPVDAGLDAINVDAFVAPPAVTAFSPDWGSTSGGTFVRMLGFGFTAPHLIVRFGSSAATQVTVVSDTELTLMTPVGPHAPVEVTVTTDGGSASSVGKFRYLAPLYAADARGTTPGNLYIVNPTNATSVAVGPLAFAVTGLALSPGGVLYGATRVSGSGDSLVTIDPYTARVTTIGVFLSDAPMVIPDLSFEGTTLFGWARGLLAQIRLTNARVTQVSSQPSMAAQGLASAGPGLLLIASGRDLCTVNTTSGAATGCVPLSPTVFGMNALTFVGTTLYGSEPTSNAPKVTVLVTINPATGAVTTVGTLPPSVDAIVGIPAQAMQNALTLPRAVVEPRVDARMSVEPVFHIGRPSLVLHDVLALASRDVRDGGRIRTIVPLAALRAFGISDRVELLSAGGESRVVRLRAPGLALTVNHRQQIKLIDTREGFHLILGAIVEVRDLSRR
jgi:hypothetical protein